MKTCQQNQRLSEIAVEPTFRIIDGVSIRFVESAPGNSDALLLGPWPESVFAYEPTWSRLRGQRRRSRGLLGVVRRQSYPTELEVLRDVLPHIQTPVQIITGRRDTVVPPVNAEYLHERLPHRELHVLDAGHFVWEDAADEFAALVDAWWVGGF
jgi:pimeloyl-ACP methyl ester carboxylesterase